MEPNATHAAPQGPAAVFQMLNAAQATAVLSAAIELNVFGKLAEGALDAEAVAQRIGCPARTTRILLDALCVLGLAARAAGTYRLTDMSATHLVPGKPMYAGDIAGILASPLMWSGMSRLADAVRSGGSVLPEHAETPRNPFWETFAKSSGSMAFAAAPALDAVLTHWIASKKTVRMLDIAAGSGIYGFALVEKHPNVELTALDWPNVLVQTKDWARRLHVDPKRVTYLEGNLFDVAYGGPYDLILLSHVYHHFDPPTCAALTRKVHGALAPGGRVVVQDFLTDQDNPPGVMFSVTMLAWTRKGEAYAAADYRKWFTESGFKAPTVHAASGMSTTFLVAENAT